MIYDKIRLKKENHMTQIIKKNCLKKEKNSR